jgi:hypothetical protein
MSMKEGGYLIIFEHNPFNPITRHIVKKCPLDKGARLLRARYLKGILTESGFKKIKVSYYLFFPKRLAVLRPYEKCLSGIPLGGQYMVIAKKEQI